MNFRKIISAVAIACASLLGFAGMAPAQIPDVNINIYGASAQFLFWEADAPAYLTAKGCTNIQQARFDDKNGITKGTCGTSPNTYTVYIRYTAKASFDGIYSLQGNDIYAEAGLTKEKCSAGDPGDPGPALRPFYRKMANETGVTWRNPTWLPECPTAANLPNGDVTSLKCVRVTLGTSDVGGDAFVQNSYGDLKGPFQCGTYASREFFGVDTAGLNVYKPLIVPFGFFVNKGVKRCVDAPVWVAGRGHFNPQNYADCSSESNRQTITNLSRMMAVMIFSGQVINWTDFGKDYVNAPIVACLRHAGSGTHSTIDLAVMHSPWGGALATTETFGDPTLPTLYFNDGSSDMMRCINSGSLSASACNGTAKTWTTTSAIGYADADQSLSAFTNTAPLAYDGETPHRINIRNGRYDNFWSVQHLYENPLAPEYSATHGWVTDMVRFASNPDNIPKCKAPFWAAYDEMHFMKADDYSYPVKTTAFDPQNP